MSLLDFHFMLLIISNQSKLKEKYGDVNFNSIKDNVVQLKNSIQDNENINAKLVFVDNQESTSEVNLNPIDENNPKKIQGLLKKFSEENNDFEDLLIVGGDSIIPFHRIPSTADKFDPIIYSDAPYGSADDDYLLPEWAAARIPDGKSNDHNFLVNQIKAAINAHQSGSSELGSTGCSAKVWRMASERIYENIQATDNLKQAPPTIVAREDITNYHYHYFNLHGSDKTPKWYGDDGNHQPVAINTQIVSGATVTNAIVLSEACYGAYVIDKNPDDSMALKYLQGGAKCVVGSTAVAYGSNNRRLFAADMIADKFFRKVDSGKRFGKAFWETKLEYYADNYGDYRDDEIDEKTLIEFVLYGDPTLKR